MKSLVRNFFENAQFVRGNIHRNDIHGALHRAWGHVFTNHIRGDYLEFGVYKGNSLVSSYQNYLMFKNWITNEMSSSEPWRKEVASKYVDFVPKFHGLDTYEGMPSSDEENHTFDQGTFKGSYEEVQSLCLANNLKDPQLSLYKGLFTDTADQLLKNVARAAIINIDSDLYFSARDALSISKNLIKSGTVLLFDDYNAFCADKNQGERLAFKEFQESFELEFEPWFSYGFSGKAFLCIG